MIIRNEREADYREVEELTRQAFWNQYTPGCDEHYLVHIMRSHEDFLPELDLVLEEDGCLIANIMYTKSQLIGENGDRKDILTFGPLSVRPGYQRKGYGKMLLEHSFQKAVECGYDAIVIFGNPENYIARGFQSCRRFHISAGEGVYPTAMLVKQLSPGAIPTGNWVLQESAVYDVDQQAAQEFDKSFAPLVKGYQTTQELFYIHSHSRIMES